MKLSCVTFAPHSRIFLLKCWFIDFHSQNNSSKLTASKNVKRKCRGHGKVFRSLTSHPKLVYSMKTYSWTFCVLWYSCFIPRLNFLVSYSSDPSPGIFFVCRHAGRSKDPRCENWNCQLLTRFPHPQMKIQIVFRKLLLYRHWSCTEVALVWVINGSTSGSELLDTSTTV